MTSAKTVYPTPTLKVRGSLGPKYGDVVPIDYITDFLSKRSPKSASDPPEKKATCLGDKVILIKAQTGTGKSTVMPIEIYKRFHTRQNKSIVVVQPRVINAIDISTNLPKMDPAMIFGVNLGYSTGVSTKKSTRVGVLFINIDKFKVVFENMTAEQIIKKYQFVIIDEAHVREQALDYTLVLIKAFLADNWQDPMCPFFIITSATFDENIFKTYFGVPAENFIEVSGSTTTIRANFPPHDLEDYIDYAIGTAIKLHEDGVGDLDKFEKDIIIFVAGEADSKAVVKGLNAYNTKLMKTATADEVAVHYIAPVPLSGTNFKAGGQEYRELYSDTKYIKVKVDGDSGDGRDSGDSGDGKKSTSVRYVTPSRRVIVATNVAETGVTIRTLKYCIDTGWAQDAEFNHDYGVGLLIKRNVTRGAAMQRRGRVGRTSEGFWYPCYTEATFKSFAADQFSKMLTGDITDIILKLIIRQTGAKFEKCAATPSKPFEFKSDRTGGLASGRLASGKFRMHRFNDMDQYELVIERPADLSIFEFMETPSAASFVFSTEKLMALGMIDQQCAPTELGLLYREFKKISVENARMIMAAYSAGCNVLETITIAAFLTGPSVKTKQYAMRNTIEGKTEYESKFYTYAVIADEFVDYILLWDEFMNVVHKPLSKIMKWCQVENVKYDSIMAVIDIRDEIIQNMISSGFNSVTSRRDPTLKRLLNSNLEDGLNEIKKIKKAIHAGYRHNVAVWNYSEQEFFLVHKPQKIEIKSELINFAQSKMQKTPVTPAQIIVSHPVIASKKSGGYHATNRGVVSVLQI